MIYSIIYARVDGYSDLKEIMKFCTVNLNFGVTLFGYSSKAQLISPWIETGFTIEGPIQSMPAD